MRRVFHIGSSLLLFGLLTVLAGALTAGVLRAQTATTTALYTLRVNVTNTLSTDQDDIQADINLSGSAFIDGNFVSSDWLNSIVQQSGTDIPAMPPTGRIQVEGAVLQDGSSFTEDTTAAQNTTQNDVELLPSAAAVDDAFYFGCDNPCRIATFDIDTAGAGTWTVTWEYWDGSAFTAFSNVDDRTSGFTSLGRRTASWDMPTNWATRTTTGSAVTSYWGRARVSAFTSQTAQPLATRAWYENGQYWLWVEDLDVDTQEQYTVSLGGSTNLVSAHQIFPGSDGIITGDAAALELGNTYSIGVVGRLDFSAAGSSACVLCKTGAVAVNVSGSASNAIIGSSITGGGTSTRDTNAVTLGGTGEQTIIIASDGTGAGTFVNSGTNGGGMGSYGPQTITDNANNLTWVSNGGLDYVDSIRLDTAAPTVFNFETTYTQFNGGTHSNTQAYTDVLGLDNQ